MDAIGSFRLTRLVIGDVTDLPMSRWQWVWAYRGGSKRHWRYQCLMPLKKPLLPLPGSAGSSIPAVTGSWGKSYPTLCEFLCASVWEDGSSRECGRLTLFWDGQDGRWKVFLNCAATSRTGCVSAEDPVALLQCVEKLLASDKVDFRPWKQGKQKGRA